MILLLLPRLRGLLDDTRAPTLGVVRIAVCSYLALWRMPAEGRGFIADVATQPAGIAHLPLFDALGVPFPPPVDVARALATALVVLSALAAVGVATRASLALLACGWLYTGSVASAFGFFHHTPALAAQVVIALCVLPGSTSLSVDRALLARLRGRAVDVPSLLHELCPPHPRFGVALLALGIGLVYFASGLAKLRFGAAAFLDGSTLAAHLRGVTDQVWYAPGGVDASFKHGIAGYVYVGGGMAPAKLLADVRPLTIALSWLTVALELAAPVCLLATPRVQLAWTAAATAFHVGIAALLGPLFTVWVIALWALAPWGFVRLRVGVWRAKRRTPRVD